MVELEAAAAVGSLMDTIGNDIRSLQSPNTDPQEAKEAASVAQLELISSESESCRTTRLSLRVALCLNPSPHIYH
jgi:hypothetical protein